MKKIDMVSMSVRSLWRRKLRTGLTVLGVIIGASSIILMLSLGLAMEQNMEEQFARWGDLTVIQVYGPWDKNDPNVITDKSLEEMAQVAHVERVIPKLSTNLQLTYGKYRTFSSMTILALEPEDLEALGYHAVQGRDVQEGQTHEVVLGGEVMRYFNKIGKEPDWDKIWSQEPLEIDLENNELIIETAYFDEKGKPTTQGSNGRVKAPKGVKVTVVGMMGEEDYSTSRNVFVSKEVYEELMKQRQKYEEALGWGSESEEDKKDKNKDKTYEEVVVKVDHRDNVVDTLNAIKELGYEAYNDMEYIEQAQQQAASKRMALGGIGIVSFFVAAIGIANTMMMSIYERTKEIGVMKVIGAKLTDIKWLFLIEALLIGGMGGILGTLISYGLSIAMNAVGGPIAQMFGMYDGSKVSIIPSWLAIGAVVFSTIVGLASGYFPARKAMKLSALSAIKTE